MISFFEMFDGILRYDKFASLHNLSLINNNFMIVDVFTNSKEVKRDSVFVCIAGERCDGHLYINEAVSNGAVAIIAEKRMDVDVPYVLVESTRYILGFLSSLIYEFPSSKLLMCGITGTNGKSTTAYMLRHILESEGVKTGILGTVIYDDGVHAEEASRTTPEASNIQKYLFRMLQNNCRACVMEVSSHGLSLGRLNGCLYDGSAFTNLSEEHLDFHGDIETYFLAKKRLFQSYMKNSSVSVANGDDAFGKRLKREYNCNISLYGMSNYKYKYYVNGISYENNMTRFKIYFSNYAYELVIPYLGRYNIYNALSAISLANELGIEIAASLVSMRTAPKVPGRFESYYLDNGVRVVIDFAHTPFALKNLLSSIREFSRGRIISVFGHGGGRFAENRSQLGKIAASFADKIIITSDNPRNEDPSSIAEQIYKGVLFSNSNTDVSIIIDRKEAVYSALNNAKSQDVLVISGKGPEREIIYENHRIPYNDFDAIVSWSKTMGVKIL